MFSTIKHKQSPQLFRSTFKNVTFVQNSILGDFLRSSPPAAKHSRHLLPSENLRWYPLIGRRHLVCPQPVLSHQRGHLVNNIPVPVQIFMARFPENGDCPFRQIVCPFEFAEIYLSRRHKGEYFYSMRETSSPGAAILIREYVTGSNSGFQLIETFFFK